MRKNIDAIRRLFPACVTEAKGQDGHLQPAIDFDLLRQELSDCLIEGQQERYQINWPGKRNAILSASQPIRKSFFPQPQESLNFETTPNLFIEGDNLDALKLLQETYLGRIKSIYIDPPYNTGKDFLDCIRNGQIWEDLKHRFGEELNVPFDLLITHAKKATEAQLQCDQSEKYATKPEELRASRKTAKKRAK